MEKTIYLQKIGEVNSIILRKLKKSLKLTFKNYIKSIKILPDPLPPLESCYNALRRQYYDRPLLDQLANLLDQLNNKENFYCLLGIIDNDIYSKKGNLKYRFVFGGAINSVALISIFRLRESYYGRPENKDLFDLRVLKEAIHEIGHLFDIEHCKNYCVMKSSKTFDEAEKKPIKFCKSCSKNLDLYIRKLH